MGAMQALGNLQLLFAGDLEPRYRELDAAVAGLDFEPALQHCTKLLEELET